MLENRNQQQLMVMKEFFQFRLPLSFGLHPPEKWVLHWREGTHRNSRSFAPDLSSGLKDLSKVDLFSVYLLSRVDIVILYIEVDFTFGLPDYVRYIEELVISRFYSIHFTLTLAGTCDIVRYIEDFVHLRSNMAIISGLGSFAVHFGDHLRSWDHLLTCTGSSSWILNGLMSSCFEKCWYLWWRKRKGKGHSL